MVRHVSSLNVRLTAERSSHIIDAHLISPKPAISFTNTDSMQGGVTTGDHHWVRTTTGST